LLDGEAVIADVKTGKRSPSAQDLATNLQLSIYSWAYRQMSRGQHEDCMEIVQVRAKKGLRAERTDAYLAHVIEDVVKPTAAAITAGHFPTNPGTLFGCNYCDYQALCAIGQGCHGGD